jgi:hypothetical protein
MDYSSSDNWHEAANPFPLSLPQGIHDLADEISANGPWHCGWSLCNGSAHLRAMAGRTESLERLSPSHAFQSTRL